MNNVTFHWSSSNRNFGDSLMQSKSLGDQSNVVTSLYHNLKYKHPKFTILTFQTASKDTEWRCSLKDSLCNPQFMESYMQNCFKTILCIAGYICIAIMYLLKLSERSDWRMLGVYIFWVQNSRQSSCSTMNWVVQQQIVPLQLRSYGVNGTFLKCITEAERYYLGPHYWFMSNHMHPLQLSGAGYIMIATGYHIGLIYQRFRLHTGSPKLRLLELCESFIPFGRWAMKMMKKMKRHRFCLISPKSVFPGYLTQHIPL